jgi:hypothetical protein
MKMNVLLISLLFFGLAGCSNSSDPSQKLIAEKERASVVEKPKAFEEFNPRVDILFVIDNSGSMSDAQENLSQNAFVFSEALAKAPLLDYHVGVTSTSMERCDIPLDGSCGTLFGDPAFITRQTPDQVEVLSRRMVMGTNGSFTEMMFNPVLRALSPALAADKNKDFFRKDAYLAIIFITDAEEQSFGVTADSFFKKLVQLKGAKNKVLAYGVMRKVAEAKECSSVEPLRDRKLEDFLAMVVNGDLRQNNILSLCNRRFGSRLAQFANDIVKRSAGRFPLKNFPRLETVKISYGTQEIQPGGLDGWSYESATNSIVLGQGIQWKPQPLGAKLSIDYAPIKPEELE